MKTLVPVVCSVLVGVLCLFPTGCETESVADSSKDLQISPSSISLHQNEYADFTASGGFEYTWSLSDPTKGFLSTTTGPTTRYTDQYDPGSNGTLFVQVLTVTSTVKGESTSPTTTTTTNSTSAYSATATAQIVHLATVGEATTTNSAISLSPSPFTTVMAYNSTEPFTASGGSGSYTWTVQDPAYGSLNTTTGSSIIYTSTYTGTVAVVQVLIVTDANDSTVTASEDIAQQN